MVFSRRIKISPKGDKKVRALSVYVQAMEYLPNAVASTTYAKLKLQLMNQKNTNHIEKRGTYQTSFFFYLGRNIDITIRKD